MRVTVRRTETVLNGLSVLRSVKIIEPQPSLLWPLWGEAVSRGGCSRLFSRRRTGPRRGWRRRHGSSQIVTW
jgi:hypothetical protein